MKEELLEDIKRHIDYTNVMNQKSIRDLQLENLFNYYNELQQRIEKAIEFMKEKEIIFSCMYGKEDWHRTLNNQVIDILEGKNENN